MVKIGSKWCLYVGDVNQDGVVDQSDIILVENDNENFVSGYVATDVNGDGAVDNSDQIIVDNNNSNFVGKIVPQGAQTAKHKKRQFKINYTK
jgi:hypothetical protein